MLLGSDIPKAIGKSDGLFSLQPRNALLLSGSSLVFQQKRRRSATVDSADPRARSHFAPNSTDKPNLSSHMLMTGNRN